MEQRNGNMKRKFNDWLSTFKESIADWTYYTNFDKVYRNVDEIKIELSMMNSLVNSKNIEEDFRLLVGRYPDVLRVIPVLIAKRESEKNGKIQIMTDEGLKDFSFQTINHSIDEYIEFLNKTGIFELLSNHIVSDLKDYITGVEVGLDSNARKNRAGTAMENIVESFFTKWGLKKGTDYFKEMYASEIFSEFGVDVTMIDAKKKANKRFDFVIKTKEMVYGIEVNFYSGGGSKLNETARSFKMLAQESKRINGFKFIWITDGIGWNSARNNLEETFNDFDDVYNLRDLETGVFEKVIK